MDATDTDPRLASSVLRQQDGGEPPRGKVGELTELASAISARVSRRAHDHETAAAEFAPESVERVRHRRRIVGTVLTVLAMAGVATAVTMLFLTMQGGSTRTTSPSTVPTASVTTARALGASAGRRVVESGGTPGMASCLAAYAADVAASPLLLPSSAHTSPARRAYVAACSEVHATK